MAGFEVTLYGRIWVTPEETVESVLMACLLEVGRAGREGPAHLLLMRSRGRMERGKRMVPDRRA